MSLNLKFRKAKRQDLLRIVELLIEDDLGQTRERLNNILDQKYIDAFELIDKDPNQFLMVVELDDIIVGTCHLTLMPSLTFQGSMRMNVEAVRVAAQYRQKKIGEWMMLQAIEYGKSRGASIIQLTTNKVRTRAEAFYKRLGFESSHEGMKLYLNQKTQ